MKIKFKMLATCACTALCALSFTACGKGTEGKSTLLGKPETTTPVSYEQFNSENYLNFKAAAENFAATFAEYTYADYDKADNFAVSPVSVYMALSLAAECAAGETRNEILNALGVSYDELKENISLLYRSLAIGHGVNSEIISELMLTNSIWVDEGTPFKQNCIDSLSEYYNCYSYAADFANGNAAANQAVRDFVKERTSGFIDKDFQLSKETLFALINTLYLKAVWNTEGKVLHFTDESYDFKNYDGTTTATKLLQGNYISGRAYEEETFSAFYTTTYGGGYKLKFILPNDGYSVDDVFTAENLQKVNSLVYQSVDDENAIIYETRCLFPEYDCSYDEDVKGILSKYYGVEHLFASGCDFSSLTYEDSFCDKVQHVTKLTVDEMGIEGAAVTIIGGVGSAEPPAYQFFYNDFVLSGAFGFIITDRNDTTLFSGVVKSV
ncbi:MAG: hypothetical protein K2H30_00140 [Clostridia bacterium]|nr:hypothetical protein [Clostridia bacterium]